MKYEEMSQKHSQDQKTKHCSPLFEFHTHNVVSLHIA